MTKPIAVLEAEHVQLLIDAEQAQKDAERLIADANNYDVNGVPLQAAANRELSSTRLTEADSLLIAAEERQQEIIDKKQTVQTLNEQIAELTARRDELLG